MVEAGIATLIAVITGGATLTSRLHRRIDDIHDRISVMDRRVDAAELTMARHYVFKDDFEKAFVKMEGHMSRIEDKLDTMMMSRRSSDIFKHDK